MRGSSGLLLLALLVSAVSACTPRAGHVRPLHPVFRGEQGQRPLSPGSLGALLGVTREPADTPAARRARDRIAGAARGVIGRRDVTVDGERYRFDCSGVARGIYATAGFPLGGQARFVGENDVSILYRWVRQNGSVRTSDPLVGDLVFFDDTYDRNRDGARNDPLSHVGVVERVHGDGTVVFVHHVAGGIVRYRMNLARPHERRDEATGQSLNHYLRRAEGGHPPKTTAELFVAYGTVVVGAPDALVARR
jgi:hypothetical protein